MGLTRAQRRERFYADLAERVVWTFIETVIGAVLAAQAFDAQVWKAAAYSGGLAALKALTLAQLGGNKGTASTLPAHLDPATPPGTAPDSSVLGDGGQAGVNELMSILGAGLVLLGAIGLVIALSSTTVGFGWPIVLLAAGALLWFAFGWHTR